MKGKEEKERYTHLNAEFQSIARREKKAFLSDQCKEIEENNRLGKTRDLFKEIRDTKGTFHAKMGSIKDRNGMDLTEAEDIQKRWQEYTEELYKKDLHDPDNHDGVITDVEPDILECEVKWALESITTELTELTESLSCLLSHLTLCNPMDCSTPGFPVHHQLPELTQTHVNRVGDAIQPSYPLSSSSPPALRVFSNESALRIMWPKYWSFNFNISPSNEHPGLISLRMD